MKSKKIKFRAQTDAEADLDELIDTALNQVSPRDILISMAKAIQLNPQWENWRGSVHLSIKELAIKFGAKEEDFWVGR